jgi:hypothetical protein
VSDAPCPRVVIDGDVVRRPAAPWTPTVHALLRHLRAAGVPGVPEPLGVEGEVERLRFLPGASGAQCWPRQATEHGLRSAARLLRAVHEASSTFVPPAGAVWAVAARDGAATVCHGDPGPWNMVWDGDTAVGLLDWDLAHPAPPLDDVACALEYFAPFRGDAHAVRWHGFAVPPDRGRRVAVFAAAYGLAGTDGLVDAVIARQRRTIVHARSLAERGVQPQRDWVAAGHLDELRARIRWSEDHRALLEEPAQ